MPPQTHFFRTLSRILFAGWLTLSAWAPSQLGAQLTLPAAGEKIPTFDVVAIKPSNAEEGSSGSHSTIDRVSFRNYSLRDLIRTAYGMKSNLQILGGPDWIAKQRFDIDAKVDDEEIAKRKNMTPAERGRQYRLLVQGLLAERFGLKVSTGTRMMPSYSLVVANKSALKLTPSKPPVPTEANPHPQGNHGTSTNNGHMKATGITMSDFADNLTQHSETGNRIVFDRTGLPGEYDFELNWTGERGGEIPADATYPGLFTALQEQLGLKLVASNDPIETVTVDFATQPVLDGSPEIVH